MRKRSSRNVDKMTAKAIGEVARKNHGELPPQNLKKNPAAVALGRLGGLKGGAARARVLSQTERTDIARRAAQARWQKERE